MSAQNFNSALNPPEWGIFLHWILWFWGDKISNKLVFRNNRPFFPCHSMWSLTSWIFIGIRWIVKITIKHNYNYLFDMHNKYFIPLTHIKTNILFITKTRGKLTTTVHNFHWAQHHVLLTFFCFCSLHSKSRISAFTYFVLACLYFYFLLRQIFCTCNYTGNMFSTHSRQLFIIFLYKSYCARLGTYVKKFNYVMQPRLID